MKENTHVTNRRKYVRKQSKRSTKIKCFRGRFAMGKNLAAGLLDIGERGVRLLLREPLEAGTDVAISLLALCQQRPIESPGKVIWCIETADGQYCAGIEFEKLLPYRLLQDM